ncbi:carboxylating nicotinate-nucleotide diphosphorylase [Haloterrigena sp. SYSU A121-1]|uniref:Nicotinate-nucleotide pyrophosphorylase [carboxylating] n=1 Tax=Haloterrigena gelatinilytica TaxID=2741724 RepID=A0A8J8KAV4_9EURY|nr:carboxylating nicotinate-nucleotide diphosphorylase [Haloterrigena gelatinilytica]NUB90655.1 carboxylating nicotinate-nucleotide diphosphorylase [Haloterrigena gelatinilytica]
MITNAQVERWLREDVGHHDVTNQVPGETTGRLVAKEPGIAAGLEAATAVFDYLGVAVDEALENGTAVDPGDELLRVEGAAREVLRGERVAVNLAGHASGIATRTNEAVERAREAQRVRESQSDSRSPSEVQSTSEDASDTRAATGREQSTESDDVRIAATRKTTPGLRGLEKRAVVAGGGDTHRLDLSHMVMVKDNHVAELGLEGAIEHFRERTSFATKLDVEVEAVDDAPRAAAAGADIVLLDNMSPAETKKAVDLLADYDALAEASGGITLETVADYAATGVDVVSMGSLTHSAPSLDLSFRTGD